MVLLNDGTLAFAAGTDPTKHTLGTCSISYRNSENPAYLKVTYKDNTLTVAMDNGSGGKDYRTCVQKSGIKLPTGYYFGVSVSSPHNSLSSVYCVSNTSMYNDRLPLILLQVKLCFVDLI